MAAVLAAAGTLLVSLRWRSDMVRVGPILTCFPYDLPTHVVYYCLGLTAFRQQWFATPGRLGNAIGWLAMCVVLTPVTCGLFGMQLDPTHGSLTAGWGFRIVSAFAWSFLCLGCFGSLLTIAQRYCHLPSRFHQHMATHSYRTYLLHLTVVVLVQLLLWSWSDLPAWLVLLVGWIVSQTGCAPRQRAGRTVSVDRAAMDSVGRENQDEELKQKTGRTAEVRPEEGDSIDGGYDQSHHQAFSGRFCSETLLCDSLTVPSVSVMTLSDLRAFNGSTCTPPPIGVMRVLPFQTTFTADSTCLGVL